MGKETKELPRLILRMKELSRLNMMGASREERFKLERDICYDDDAFLISNEEFSLLMSKYVYNYSTADLAKEYGYVGRHGTMRGRISRAIQRLVERGHM